MHFEAQDDTIIIRLDQHLNFFTARKIERLVEGYDKIILDLQKSRLVDTEGIILIHRLVTSEKDVTLLDAPDVFFKNIEALDLGMLLKAPNLHHK